MSSVAWSTAFSMPARSVPTRAGASDAATVEAATLRQGRSVIDLVRQGLTAAWVPYCPDLMNEVARGTGRQD